MHAHLLTLLDLDGSEGADDNSSTGLDGKGTGGRASGGLKELHICWGEHACNVPAACNAKKKVGG